MTGALPSDALLHTPVGQRLPPVDRQEGHRAWTVSCRVVQIHAVLGDDRGELRKASAATLHYGCDGSVQSPGIEEACHWATTAATG